MSGTGRRTRCGVGGRTRRSCRRPPGLTPGRALDIGAGEGADAIWLAERGWDVVAVDISSVALERGRRQAEVVGVADRITWVHTDVLADDLPAGPFDLVTSHYTHLASAGSHRPVLTLFRRGRTWLAPC